MYKFSRGGGRPEEPLMYKIYFNYKNLMHNTILKVTLVKVFFYRLNTNKTTLLAMFFLYNLHLLKFLVHVLFIGRLGNGFFLGDVFF